MCPGSLSRAIESIRGHLRTNSFHKVFKMHLMAIKLKLSTKHLRGGTKGGGCCHLRFGPSYIPITGGGGGPPK